MMVRKIYDQVLRDGVHYVKAAGLSTDQKPTAGICTGSYFIEVNTAKEYLFDESLKQWYEAPSGYIAP